MALIEKGRLFSQHSLSTFARCKRRFYLKYVAQQPWPMPESDDLARYEAHLARGRLFHQWIARALLGLPMARIAAASEDDQLRAWWQAYSRFDLQTLPVTLREVELPLVVPLGDYRLYARFDLVALNPGKEAIIVDWKTLESIPAYHVMRDRWQTRVYLYVLVAAGHVLTGGQPIDSAQARMLYWFAEHDTSIEIPYSEAEHRRAGQALRQIVQEITTLPEAGFVLTDDLRQCGRCNFRSLCNRAGSGSQAAIDWLGEEIDFDLDLAESAEIEY